MTVLQAYFKACQLYYRTYLRWDTENNVVRGYHLHLAKRDLEIARSMMNVERKKVKHER